MSRLRLPSAPVLSAGLSVLLCGLLSLVGVAGLVLTAPTASAAAPLRVLLTGDSITHGWNGDYTWRYRLYKEFQRQGVPVDFVGSWTMPYAGTGYSSASYADPHFDQDHFARLGWELREMVGKIGAEVRTQQPDVIVLEAGVNDFRHHQTDRTIVASTEVALRAWIANVRAAKPDTRIVVSPVLSVDTAAGPAVNPLIRRYDADLPGIVGQLTTAQSPITLAATNQGWNPSGAMSWDGLHPSPTGETFIAQRIAETLRRVGLLPDVPKVYRSVAWPHTVRAVVKVTGTRAIVSWSREAVGAARVKVQRVGRAAMRSGAFLTTGAQGFTVVRGAKYDVRVQVRRGRMIGPWGPVTRVVVPTTKRPPAPRRVVVNATGIHWTAAPGARSYVVSFHQAHQKRWTTRRTTALQVLAKQVTAAKVKAVGAGGSSAWRSARR